MSTEPFFEKDGMCRPTPTQFRDVFSAHGVSADFNVEENKYPSLLAIVDASADPSLFVTA
jgi:hypothetical protein